MNVIFIEILTENNGKLASIISPLLARFASLIMSDCLWPDEGIISSNVPPRTLFICLLSVGITLRFSS